jgi:hypothetical protein
MLILPFHHEDFVNRVLKEGVNFYGWTEDRKNLQQQGKRTLYARQPTNSIPSKYPWTAKKSNDLISSISPNLPHILGLSEHHLKQFKLDQDNIKGYKLATSYCRRQRKRGCMHLHTEKFELYKGELE